MALIPPKGDTVDLMQIEMLPPEVHLPLNRRSEDRDGSLTQYLKSRAGGFEFTMRTESTRTSVTVSAGGNDLAYFRKADIPVKVVNNLDLYRVLRQANKADYVCRLLRKDLPTDWADDVQNPPKDRVVISPSRKATKAEQAQLALSLLRSGRQVHLNGVTYKTGAGLVRDYSQELSTKSPAQQAIATALEEARQQSKSQNKTFWYFVPETTFGFTPGEAIQSTTEKEDTMTISNTITKTVEANKAAAAQAGYLEAGRIANNQVAALAGKHLPFMLRGYADTPVGKLVIANLAALAAAQLRPEDRTLAKLTQAMTVEAFQEIYQKVDIEGMINSLLASPEIKAAVDKLPKDIGTVGSNDFGRGERS